MTRVNGSESFFGAALVLKVQGSYLSKIAWSFTITVFKWNMLDAT